MADLVEELAEYVGPKVAARARASLIRPPSTVVFAESVARFFEGGLAD
ncbi:MAG: hypothetical protein AAF509_05500 [Pseudomonadota bacterium]